MNILGIIAEYNPFHNGHLHHIKESKKATNADAVVCVMSGNFVQRGEPAIIDKWSRTQMALNNGVDLVIELPTIYSISSAENFSEGALKLLNSLNIVNVFSFGSECGNIETLNEIADVFYTEPPEYQTMLNRELKNGISFPKAREKALLLYLNNLRKYASILSSPNNTLGIEYLKTLKKFKYKILAMTVKREAENSSDKTGSKVYKSSSNIRELLNTNQYKAAANTMPKNVLTILNKKIKKGQCVYGLHAYEKEIIYSLRKMSVEEIANLPDVSEGLEYSIKKAASNCNTLSDLLDAVKSKRYTLTRIKRIMLYVLLDIKKSDMEISKKIKSPYIRVLGFSNKGEEVLSQICQKRSKLPIITSVKHFIENNSNKNLQRLLEIDLNATNMYTLGYKQDSKSELDFTQPIVKP